MPILKIPIPDTKDSVFRPIVSSICEKMITHFGLTPTPKILYTAENGVEKQLGSVIGDKNNNATFGGDSLLTIEVTEEITKDMVMNQMTWVPEYPPIFIDKDLKIEIKPIYREAWLNFELKYRIEDKVKAQRWLDDMMFTFVEYQHAMHHKLVYHYLIPEEIIYVLENIHKKRETIAGYGESFDHYLKDKMSKRLTWVTDQGGKRKRLAIAENQSCVYGQLENDGELEKGEKNDGNSTWIVSFPYKVHYSRITHLCFTYPQVVHQQPLEYPLVRETTYEDENGEIRYLPESDYPREEDRLYTLSRYFLEETSSINKVMEDFKKLNGFSIPRDDEFYPPTIITDTDRIFNVQLLFEESDGGKKDLDLLDLKNIPEFKINEDVLKFMVGEIKYMPYPTKSVFQINIYNQHDMLHYDHIYINSDLIVKNNFPINLRNNYHIRLGVYYDLSLLDKDALDRLEKSGVMDKIIDKNKRTDKEFASQIRTGTMTPMKTVEHFSIESYHHDQNPNQKTSD
jgi:hypothetical protein